MPRGDGTGPMGQGPKTGRGLGPCGGGRPRSARSGAGLMQRAGSFFRRGRGRGQRSQGGMGPGGRGSGRDGNYQSKSSPSLVCVDKMQN